ncbi:MAG: enoyl-CoA hydratase/isomerase family protein [Rhodovibrionaceae bacterium]|nr:enoyl-CoA hydratase/isomerase family protein [Rhodovibrionaceae bacterium]
MTEQAIKLEKLDGGIALLTLDRPPANALNPDLLAALDGQLQEIVESDEVRAVVVTGAGRLLSAGMDLKELQGFAPEEERATVEWLNRCFGTLYSMPLPVVAAANGHAIAGGLFLVLASDYRVASERALFGLAEVRVGVSFPVAPMEIARAELPPHALRRLMLSGANISADQAERIGIADELAPPDGVVERALAVARDYAALPPKAYAAVKAQVRAEAILRIRAAVEDRQEPLLTGWFTEETRAAARAQLEAAKRS